MKKSENAYGNGGRQRRTGRRYVTEAIPEREANGFAGAKQNSRPATHEADRSASKRTQLWC